MAEYSENTKLNIGDLVLKINDLETRLARLRNRGDALVVPLRAIADLFDPDQRDKKELLLAEDQFFATTHSVARHREQVSIAGILHPAFSYPSEIKELLQETFETEKELRQLEKALQNSKQRARRF